MLRLFKVQTLVKLFFLIGIEEFDNHMARDYNSLQGLMVGENRFISS
jgi:hypothetical protein